MASGGGTALGFAWAGHFLFGGNRTWLLVQQFTHNFESHCLFDLPLWHVPGHVLICLGLEGVEDGLLPENGGRGEGGAVIGGLSG